MKKIITILTLITILVSPVTCYAAHPRITAGGIDYVDEIDDESQDVYMSHKSCVNVIKKIDDAKEKVGIGGMFLGGFGKAISIAIGSVYLSLHVNKAEIERNDHGNGIVMRQYFFPEGSVTMNVKPQQVEE